MDYQFIIDNVINGNISDAKEAISKLSKKDLLLFITQYAEMLSASEDYENKTYSDNGYWDAIQKVYKLLD